MITEMHRSPTEPGEKIKEKKNIGSGLISIFIFISFFVALQMRPFHLSLPAVWLKNIFLLLVKDDFVA